MQASLEDLITCSICLETLNKPKTLGCLHTFCESCLLLVFDANNGAAVNCPTCRQEDTRDPRQMPVDFRVMQIIDSLRGAGKVAALGVQDSAPVKPRQLDVVQARDMFMCRTHASQSAAGFCQSCEGWICSKCLIREHRAHNVIEVQERVQAVLDMCRNECEAMKNNALEKFDSIEEVTEVIRRKMAETDQVRDAVNARIHDFRRQVVEALDATLAASEGALEVFYSEVMRRYDKSLESFQSSYRDRDEKSAAILKLARELEDGTDTPIRERYEMALDVSRMVVQFRESAARSKAPIPNCSLKFEVDPEQLMEDFTSRLLRTTNLNPRISMKEPSLTFEQNLTAKAVTFGASGVGKTCIIERYVDNHFRTNYVSTIGCDFKIKSEKFGEGQIRLQLWDTAGQERFGQMAPIFFRGAHALVAVVDLSDPDSFNCLTNLDQCKRQVPLKILIANKADLPHSEEAIRRAQELARENGMTFFITSAKTGQGVDRAFRMLAAECANHRLMSMTPAGDKEKVQILNKQKKDDCCVSF